MRMRGKKPIFSKRDMWNLDYTLSPIIAAGIEKFIEVLKVSPVAGHPMIDLSTVPRYVYEGKESPEWEAWLWMLEEMVYTFRYDEHKDNIYWEAYSRTFDTFAENGTFQVNTDKTLERQYYWAAACVEARRQRGMHYFSKYFKNLWI